MSSSGDGRCRMCKRRLTNPESLKIGVGPGCLRKIRGTPLRIKRGERLVADQLELPFPEASL